MPPIVAQLLGQPETETFDLKGTLDLSKLKDGLKVVADLVAMANTYGGGLLVGAVGFPIRSSHLPLFDSARLDDKVNSCVEPRIGGITTTILTAEFILLEIEKSVGAPHMFTRDGNCEDENGKPVSIFRKGDIYVRHSSKSERANRSDFDRWFEERRVRLFENVKIIFDASPNAEVLVKDAGGVPVRIAPDEEGAQPVFDLITTLPFRDVPQELAAGVKAWKSSRHLLSEIQVYKAYRERESIRDHEVIELILRSCWNLHLHGYMWAAKLDPSRLWEVLVEVASADVAPSSTELLHVASLLPRGQARQIFEIASDCEKKGPRNKAKRLAPVLSAHRRKLDALLRLLYSQKVVVYEVAAEKKVVPIPALDSNIFDEILGTLIEGMRHNRAAFRGVEAVLFGSSLSAITFPDLGGEESLEETQPEADGNGDNEA
jgi:hypothetical protein